ncbi:hypothetical protein [Legionella micdadei]|uniref:hypothetical protein n=1 Tax=Legionella micdadei TaxID=451 RepID=UPI0009EF7251|nr:hypothetical protein [Legionella micdadei]ARH00907.1 hypothetical protein B6V88_11055 [Legionella micdadei]NSL18572.1 hypothetical protein [Legionella micdadei]
MQEKFDKSASIFDLFFSMDYNSVEKDDYFDFIIQPENWSRLIDNIYPIRQLVQKFPERKDGLYRLIIQPENWLPLVTHASTLVTLVNLFPERKDELYEVATRPDNWSQLVARSKLTQRGFNPKYEVSKILAIFPEKRNELYQFIIESDNWSQLKISSLIELFPERTTELYQLIVQSRNREQLITSLLDIESMADNFSDKENFFDFIIQSGVLIPLINNSNDLSRLSSIFPKCEMFKKSTVEEVVAKLERLKRPEEKAYTQGALVGLFENRLPAEVSHYIGGFLNRKAGGEVSLVNKAAASLAQEEQERARSLTP